MQPSPDGLAQAFIIGADHVGDEPVGLVLGDNIFYGGGLGARLRRFNDIDGAAVFGYRVADPTAYGVVEFDERRQGPLAGGEAGASRRAATPSRASTSTPPTSSTKAAALKPSARGELEITDLNRVYLERGPAPGRGAARAAPPGSTPGPFEDLDEASNFVRAIEHRQGLKIGCPEEVAWRMGFIDDDRLARRPSR